MSPNMFPTFDLTPLLTAYQEPQRQYHNMVHIRTMLDFVRDYNLTITSMQLASIWYHDFVYDPKAADNEELSAIAAGIALTTEGWDVTSIGVVQQIIRDTQNHLPNHEQSKLVIDLDLAGLGDSSSIYFAKGALIRKEYQHLTDAEWNAGRLKFIEKFLSRPQIFQTNWGLTHFERGARSNLTEERNRLQEVTGSDNFWVNG